jgi:hypothetical protein
MITYKTLYWIVMLIAFIISIITNSFDDSFLYPNNKFIGTFKRRLITSTSLYILSWVIWFILF